MPSSWITKSDSGEIRLAHPVNRSKLVDGIHAVYDLANDPALQDADKDRLAQTLQILIQEDLTHRMKVRDLPSDDPDRDTDPASFMGEKRFWEGQGGNKDIVSRSTIVSVTWNEAEGKFDTSMRVARPA